MPIEGTEEREWGAEPQEQNRHLCAIQCTDHSSFQYPSIAHCALIGVGVAGFSVRVVAEELTGSQ